MSYKSAIQELDVLLPMTEFGVKNLGVIQSAMAEEATDMKNGSDALFCTYEYLKDLHDQMTTLVNRAINDGREQTILAEVAV